MMDKHGDFSPFAYCYNNPINLIDPFGLDTVPAGQVSFGNFSLANDVIDFGSSENNYVDNSTGNNKQSGGTNQGNLNANSGGGKEFSGLPENLAAATGTLAGMIEAGKVSGDMWFSPKTGKWYSMSTANGATGPRKPVVKSAKGWNNAAKGAFYAGVIISTGDMIYYYSTGGTGYEKAAWTGTDIAVGAIATWGGPVGMAVGVVYLVATSPHPLITSSPYITDPMSPWNTMPRVDNTGINNGGGF